MVRTIQRPPVRCSVRCALALAVVLALASCSSQQPSTARPSPRPASAPVITTRQIPTPHRQWLNLAYAAVSSAEKLDLYVPIHRQAHSGPPGLVVYVHGGAWLEGQGDKANPWSVGFVNIFLSLGYAAASINYRLSNQAHFPAQIQDVKTAVRWLRAHAREYGYDPTEIAAVGDSSGGQLVALLGASEGVPALEGASLGNPRVSSSIKAAIVLYPDINLLAEETWLSQNPACAGKHLNPDLADSPASKYLGAPIQTVPGRAKAADPITYPDPRPTTDEIPHRARHTRLHRALPGIGRVLRCAGQGRRPIGRPADHRARRGPLPRIQLHRAQGTGFQTPPGNHWPRLEAG